MKSTSRKKPKLKKCRYKRKSYWVWAAMKHMRSNRRIVFLGINKTVQEWGEYLGVQKGTLLSRFRHNWSTQKALTEPVKR